MPNAFHRLKDFLLCAAALGKSPHDKWAIFWRETKNIRVRLKMATYHPGDVYSLQTVYGPLHFRDNFGDITNLVGLYYHQVYRPRRLPHDGVIVDIGANIGLAAALFAHYNPGRPIFCFEPLSANAALVELNCPHATVERVALGARQNRVTLQVDADSVMASSITCDWDTHEETFDVIPLDAYAQEKRWDRIALMKIDTEGMELDILQGGAATLRKTQEVVMETHEQFRHDASMRLLREAGFTIDADEFDGHTGFVFASRHPVTAPVTPSLT